MQLCSHLTNLKVFITYLKAKYLTQRPISPYIRGLLAASLSVSFMSLFYCAPLKKPTFLPYFFEGSLCIVWEIWVQILSRFSNYLFKSLLISSTSLASLLICFCVLDSFSCAVFSLSILWQTKRRSLLIASYLKMKPMLSWSHWI